MPVAAHDQDRARPSRHSLALRHGAFRMNAIADEFKLGAARQIEFDPVNEPRLGRLQHVQQSRGQPHGPALNQQG